MNAHGLYETLTWIKQERLASTKSSSAFCRVETCVVEENEIVIKAISVCWAWGRLETENKMQSKALENTLHASMYIQNDRSVEAPRTHVKPTKYLNNKESTNWSNPTYKINNHIETSNVLMQWGHRGNAHFRTLHQFDKKPASRRDEALFSTNIRDWQTLSYGHTIILPYYYKIEIWMS